MRNGAAEVVVAVSFFFGVHDSIYVELMTLHQGLEVCLERDFLGIQVETESMLIINWLRHPSSQWLWKHFPLLFSIRQALEQLSAFIIHVYGESNSVADGLARLASSTYRTQFFATKNIPRFLRGLVILHS